MKNNARRNKCKLKCGRKSNQYTSGHYRYVDRYLNCAQSIMLYTRSTVFLGAFEDSTGATALDELKFTNHGLLQNNPLAPGCRLSRELYLSKIMFP